MTEQLSLGLARARRERTLNPRRVVEEMSLDNYLPGDGPARARRTDPESSHVAADTAERRGIIRRHAEIVRGAVERYPGLTSKRYADVCPLDRVQVARRLPELERRGLIRRVSKRGAEERWFPR